MQITSENFTVQNDSEDIFLPDLGIKANRQKHKFLLESDGLDLCKKLLQVPHTQFTITNEGTIRIHIGGLVLDLQAYCEIFVLHEIFFAGTYNILTPKDIVVWDIGMNVGIASLYFASKENVIDVFSYEPFPATYELAKHNLALNPTLAEKIQAHNYGIGADKRTVTVDYCLAWHGSSTLTGFPQFIQERDDLIQQDITLVSAGDILESIRSKHPGVDIIAKIDCEGAEYEIIQSLYASKKLQHLQAVLFEWHKPEKNQELQQFFLESGFNLLYFNLYHEYGVGMAYAFKHSPKG
jgi:FkbM family methyltransferase